MAGTTRRTPLGYTVEDGPVGLYLVDEDWMQARHYVEDTGHPTFVRWDVDTMRFTVEIREDDAVSVREWGVHESLEVAWRFALGAHFGSHEDPPVHPWEERYHGELPYNWIGNEMLDLRDIADALLDDDDDMAREALYIKRVFEAQSSMDFDRCAHNEPTLIREDFFEQYAQELAEDIGAVDRNANWPVYRIDWAAAAEDLKQDYSEYQIDGIIYYGRMW